MYLVYLFILRKGFGFKKEDHPDQENFRVQKVTLRPGHFLKLDIRQVFLNGKQLNRANAWATLVISTLVMSIGSWMLVKGSELLGHDEYRLTGLENLLGVEHLFGIETLRGLGLPIIFISVLLAAAATSIPDTMISVRDARKGNHDDSISNAMGSNIFDISFALGLPLLLYTLINGSLELSQEVRILSISSWLLMWMINLVVIPIFIYSKRITRGIGVILLLLYLVFIFLILGEVNRFEWISENIQSFLEFMN